MPREVTSCWPQSTKECRALTSEDALRSGTGHSVLAVGGREPRAPKKTPTKGEGAREDEAELGINSLASLLRTGLNWQILFLSRQSSPILDASRACLLSRLSQRLSLQAFRLPPGSSVPGVLQARILEWVAMPSSRGSALPRDQTQVSCIGRRVLYHSCHLGSPGVSHRSGNVKPN